MKYLQPDYEFEHFTDLSIEFLNKHNIKAIFSDLDSTLTAHNQIGNDEFGRWHQELESNQIKLVVVSNNNQGRVDRFTEPNHILGYGNCKKPMTKTIKKIMNEVGVHSGNSLFLGDQLFTDILCGKWLGMKTVLVKPLGQEHEPWVVRWKRGVEANIKKRW